MNKNRTKTSSRFTEPLHIIQEHNHEQKQNKNNGHKNHEDITRIYVLVFAFFLTGAYSFLKVLVFLRFQSVKVGNFL